MFIAPSSRRLWGVLVVVVVGLKLSQHSGWKFLGFRFGICQLKVEKGIDRVIKWVSAFS